MYYRGAAAAVIVYDITSMDSFHRAKSWVKELQRQGSPDVVIALAGNKIDREEEREVSSDVRFALFPWNVLSPNERDAWLHAIMSL